MSATVIMLAIIAALVPIGLYLLIIAKVGDRVASLRVRLTRPLWLMLLISPGISLGHGIGVAPMFVMMAVTIPAKDELGGHGDQVALNAIIWLFFAFCGFLAELWVADRRTQRRLEAGDPDELRDRSDAPKQLGDRAEK